MRFRNGTPADSFEGIRADAGPIPFPLWPIV